MIIATVIAGVTSAPNGLTLKTAALLSVAAGAFVATEIVTRRQLENKKRNERRRRKAAERKGIVGVAFKQKEHDDIYVNPINALEAEAVAKHGSAQDELVTESEEEAVFEVNEQTAVELVAVEEMNVWANFEVDARRQVVYSEAWDHPEPVPVPENAEHDDVAAVDVNVERQDDGILDNVEGDVSDAFDRDVDAGMMAVSLEAREDHLAQPEHAELDGEAPIDIHVERHEAGGTANVEVDFAVDVEADIKVHISDFDVEAGDDRQAQLEEAENYGDGVINIEVERQEAGVMAAAEVDVEGEHRNVDVESHEVGVMATVGVDSAGNVEVRNKADMKDFNVEARDDHLAQLEEAGNYGHGVINIEVEREEAGVMAAAEVDVEGELLGRVFEDNDEVNGERDITVKLEDMVKGSIHGDLEGGVNGEFTDDNMPKLEGSVEGNLELDIEGDRQEPRVEPITTEDDVGLKDKIGFTEPEADVDCEKVKRSSGEEGIEEYNVDGPEEELVCGLHVDACNDDERREAEDWSEVEEDTYTHQKIVDIPKWVSAFKDEGAEEKGSDNHAVERPEEWSDVEEEVEEKKVDGVREDADNRVEDEYFNDSTDRDSWDSRKGPNAPHR
ncbi:hypothetical protein BC829DRAFT_436475 [Chytridium lagenaria]|nr:hypothetical protein BC829DRAFT_436475 [Chytridium lagenaria]